MRRTIMGRHVIDDENWRRSQDGEQPDQDEFVFRIQYARQAYAYITPVMVTNIRLLLLTFSTRQAYRIGYCRAM